MDNTPRQSTFKRNAHIAYFRRCLQALPASATGQDPNRITLAYFCLSGLDLLGVFDTKISEADRRDWAEWIWSLQHPSGGFRGSTFMTTPSHNSSPPHLPSTYTALLCLAILRAPLDRLDVQGLTTFLQSCQGSDGSFSPLPRHILEGDFQSDLRMTYCASIVADIINTGKGKASFDRHSAVEMVKSCQTWEGGYAARPQMIEAQGGTTYCALASLSLLSSLPQSSTSPAGTGDPTLRWLLQRQIGGFQGRPGKLEDVCYSFWCGAALSIIEHGGLVNSEEDRDFLLSAQSPMGGFGKEPEEYPDPYHSYLALAALAIHDQRDPGVDNAEAPGLGLKSLDERWNVNRETATWLRSEILRVKG